MGPLAAATIVAAALASGTRVAPAAPAGPLGHEAAARAVEEARAERTAGREDLERVALERAAAADPGWDLPRLDLAELLLRAGPGESGAGGLQARAGALLAEAGRLREENPRLHRLRGALLEVDGDLAGAAAAYARALELREDAEVALRLGLVLQAAGRAAESADALSRALRFRPRDRLARSALADALGAMGRRAEAEALLRELVAEEPASAAPLRRLARFLADGGEVERAAAVEREAQALETAPRRLRPLQRDRR
ncbi:MAG TPA: hypothetical protein VH880_10180 [Anaeromyxobacteraceae bacterium]